MKKPLLIQGMHGLGDCLHQRAVLRQVMPFREVWLETSWPSIYHDLVGPDLHLMKRPVSLRTQSKNASRESAKFDGRDPPRDIERMRVGYGGAEVRATGSKTVLEGMCRATFTDYQTADYRLPVPDVWKSELFKTLGTSRIANTKPVLVYRPLVARPEWRGSLARNANETCYAHLFAFLREHFFVISVADLEPGKEWIVGPRLHADMEFHSGELTFEGLAALFHHADLVFTSSGFAAILAPAVGTPCINIVGGYEDPRAHDSGKRFAPLLSIGPREPCSCWTSACNQVCRKDIDMHAAVEEMAKFMRPLNVNILPRLGDPAEMFDLTPTRSGLPQQHAALVVQNLRAQQGLKA